MFDPPKKAKELVPEEVGQVIDALYEGEGYKIITSSSEQILGNVQIDRDYEKGKLYFDGSLKFTDSLNQV